LNAAAAYSTVVDMFDSLGAKHSVTCFFFKTGQNQYTVRGYVKSDEVDANTTYPGEPRQIFSKTIGFDSDGSRTTPPTSTTPDANPSITWNNGSSSSTVIFNFDPFTQYSSGANISSINQNGKGIGTIGNVSIEKNGDIFALLNNGQAAVIGTVGLVNFANPEGLVRTGGTLLQQSPESGEPVIGKPKSGTFGALQSGSLELSTVDIANEFVKMITIQRGFQANSRIITTINQLLNDIIQLV
jgi:flagellar hook protein FlgE